MDTKRRLKAIVGNELYEVCLSRLYRCIANAFSYVHQQHIKHNDLKPRSVLLTYSGLRITGFGASTDFSAVRASVSEDGDRGTPKYRAPEVSEHRRSVDQRTYSLLALCS